MSKDYYLLLIQVWKTVALGLLLPYYLLVRLPLVSDPTVLELIEDSTKMSQAEISIPQSQHFRNLVAIIFAMVIGVIVVGTIESIGHAVYPPPADLDMNDANQMKEYVAKLPVTALLVVIAGWAAGIFSGCLFAGIMGFRQGKFCSVVYSIIFCSVVGLMLFQVPLPLGFTLFGIIALAPSAFAGWAASQWILARLQRSSTSGSF